MGLETYLFRIKYTNTVAKNEVPELMGKCGLALVDPTDGYSTNSYFFEAKSAQGLVEAHCIFEAESKHLRSCYMRFSMLSPDSVIEMIFDIFARLNELTPITVLDNEVDNHLYMLSGANHDNSFSFEKLDLDKMEQLYEERCRIPIDAKIFRQNDYGIQKRNIILANKDGMIIRSGTDTTDTMQKKGLVDKYFGWISKIIRH